MPPSDPPPRSGDLSDCESPLARIALPPRLQQDDRCPSAYTPVGPSLRLRHEWEARWCRTSVGILVGGT